MLDLIAHRAAAAIDAVAAAKFRETMFRAGRGGNERRLAAGHGDPIRLARPEKPQLHGNVALGVMC